MAGKTYRVVFTVLKVGAFQDYKNVLFPHSPAINQAIFKNFQDRLTKKYPGTSTDDFKTFTTTAEVQPVPITFSPIIDKSTPEREAFRKELSANGHQAGGQGEIRLLPLSTDAPAPAPVPKAAPKAAPAPAPPVDTSKPKKTYKVTFLVPNVGTFQDHGNVLFSDSRDKALLTKFEKALKAKIKGDLSEDKKTFMTSEDVKLNPAGYYKLLVQDLLEPEEDEEGEKGDSGNDSDEEETNVGEINLFPVKTGGKKRKTRRSTRRKRTTRRR